MEGDLRRYALCHGSRPVTTSWGDAPGGAKEGPKLELKHEPSLEKV